MIKRLFWDAYRGQHGWHLTLNVVTLNNARLQYQYVLEYDKVKSKAYLTFTKELMIAKLTYAIKPELNSIAVLNTPTHKGKYTEMFYQRMKAEFSHDGIITAVHNRRVQNAAW